MMRDDASSECAQNPLGRLMRAIGLMLYQLGITTIHSANREGTSDRAHLEMDQHCVQNGYGDPRFYVDESRNVWWLKCLVLENRSP